MNNQRPGSGIVQGADGSATIYAPTARIVAGSPDNGPVGRCPLCLRDFNWTFFAAHARECAWAHPVEFERLKASLAR